MQWILYQALSESLQENDKNFPKPVMSKPEVLFYEFGPFRLDVVKRLLLPEDETVPLSPKVFEMLLAFLEHGG